MSAVFTCVGRRPGWQWCELQRLVTRGISPLRYFYLLCGLLIEPFKCLSYSRKFFSHTVDCVVVVKPIFKFANSLFGVFSQLSRDRVTIALAFWPCFCRIFINISERIQMAIRVGFASSPISCCQYSNSCAVPSLP